jgi:hypothetical protein
MTAYDLVKRSNDYSTRLTQKTIDVVRKFPPQILIHNKSRLAYLDNSQDHLSLPRMKLGLIGLIAKTKNKQTTLPQVYP